MKTKKCKGPCSETKSLDEFYKDRRMKDGHYAWCKECCKAKEMKRWQEQPLALWATNKRSSSKRTGKPIIPTVPELTDRAKKTLTCELTNLPLTYGVDNGGKIIRSTASIDHVHPDLPGIMENLGIIRDPFNMAKGTGETPALTEYMHILQDNKDQLRWYFTHEYEPVKVIPYIKRKLGQGMNHRRHWASIVETNHKRTLNDASHGGRHTTSMLHLWQTNIDEIYSVIVNLNRCEMCGRPIYYTGEVPERIGKGKGGVLPDTASFDRINVTKPYTIENIGIICGQCNRFKGTGNLQEILDDLRAYLKQEDDLVAEYQKRAEDLRKNYVIRGNPQRRIDDFNGADLQLG